MRVAVVPEGETFVCRLMAPLNPLRLVSVIVEEFENPDCTVSDAWLEEIEKSGATVTVTNTRAI